MRAVLVQYDIAWEDKASNHAAVREMLSGVDARPDDLVVLPEMFDTGFSMNTEVTGADGEASEGFLRGMARERGHAVIGGITVVPAGGGKARNRAIVADGSGEVVARYDKMHPFSFGREPERFEGGGEVVTWRWGVGVACPAVCYDLRFPELFRVGRGRGAEVFVVIANWPAARDAHWRALLIARAIENQAVVVGVNRCGADPFLEYAGGTMAVNEQGEVMADLGGEVGLGVVAVDLEGVRSWRAAFPAWHDRRSGFLPGV